MSRKKEVVLDSNLDNEDLETILNSLPTKETKIKEKKGVPLKKVWAFRIFSLLITAFMVIGLFITLGLSDKVFSTQFLFAQNKEASNSVSIFTAIIENFKLLFAGNFEFYNLGTISEFPVEFMKSILYFLNDYMAIIIAGGVVLSILLTIISLFSKKITAGLNIAVCFIGFIIGSLYNILLYYISSPKSVDIIFLGVAVLSILFLFIGALIRKGSRAIPVALSFIVLLCTAVTAIVQPLYTNATQNAFLFLLNPLNLEGIQNNLISIFSTIFVGVVFLNTLITFIQLGIFKTTLFDVIRYAIQTILAVVLYILAGQNALQLFPYYILLYLVPVAVATLISLIAWLVLKKNKKKENTLLLPAPEDNTNTEKVSSQTEEEKIEEHSSTISVKDRALDEEDLKEFYPTKQKKNYFLLFSSLFALGFLGYGIYLLVTTFQNPIDSSTIILLGVSLAASLLAVILNLIAFAGRRKGMSAICLFLYAITIGVYIYYQSKLSDLQQVFNPINYPFVIGVGLLTVSFLFCLIGMLMTKSKDKMEREELQKEEEELDKEDAAIEKQTPVSTQETTNLVENNQQETISSPIVEIEQSENGNETPVEQTQIPIYEKIDSEEKNTFNRNLYSQQNLQQKENQSNHSSFNSQMFMFDLFLSSLTDEEREEFAKMFIQRMYGETKALPVYQMGGDNYEFFKKFFLYLGKYRTMLSDSLLDKIYAYSLSINH